MKNLKVLFFVTLFTLISIDTSLFCMNQELKNNTESHQEQASFLGKFSDIAADVFYSMERSEQNQYELIGYQKKSEDIKVTTKKGKVIIELEDPIIHKNPKRGFLKNCFKLVNPCKTFLDRKISELCKKNSLSCYQCKKSCKDTIISCSHSCDDINWANVCFAMTSGCLIGITPVGLNIYFKNK